MSEERYPSDLVITKEDFTDSGWKAILDSSNREGYSAMWNVFSDTARQAIEVKNLAKGKVLWLLADACSMRLSPKSPNEPFNPSFVDGKRSVNPDDLSETDIQFYSQIVDEIDDQWLRARIADLVWLKQQPRDVRFSLIAIDSYREFSLDTETWIRGGCDCWQRAISLVLMLGQGAGNRLKEMVDAIVKAIESATVQDGYLASWLSGLLSDNRLARSQARSIAEHLETLAQEFDEAGDLRRTRDYYCCSARWFKKSGDEARSIEMTVAVAESWVREAVARISIDGRHMEATCFYENAIQTYRTIPRTERSVHRVDERIVELRKHLNESGEKSLGEMSVVRSPEIDLAQIVENAREAVRGKEPVEALKAFANHYQGLQVKELRKHAISHVQNYPLQGLFPATVMSRDGRVIAKQPGMNYGDLSSDDNEAAIRFQMIQEYRILLGIVVQGDILPALEILLQEHRFREADLVNLASQSPIVPKGREVLFGRALFAGFDQDMVVAIHLLVPQIENMVRVHLKSANVTTTRLDSNGIETENGLSALMELAEVEKVFGENVAFEIKSLFCDAFGPNLRNELAHGLICNEDCQSVYAIYAWWFGLRLVFNTYWNAALKDETDDKKETSA